ncbi:hypothetical protein PL81_26550, partial [Streptomyces sp. RSD-27]
MSDHPIPWALTEAPDGRWHATPVPPTGRVGGPLTTATPAEAIRSAPPATRWIWRSTQAVYPRLLAAGV